MKTLTTLLAVAMLSASALAADGPIRHVVSFKFKKDADPDKVKKVEESFAALKGKIKEIQDLEWGTNVSPEKHSKGFTHVWFVTFKTAADRDAYLVHPDHKAFGAGLKDVIEDVFVVDYVPKE
ncbi:MAG: Dabb family protein [Chthoniobacteraceae bacterium]